MELESGSPSVDRGESRGRRRVSDGGSHSGGGACSGECQYAGVDRRDEAHLSRNVGHHVAAGTGADGAERS